MSQVTSLTGQEYLHKILLSRIYDVARVTPLQKLDKLSERLHCKVLLKREDYPRRLLQDEEPQPRTAR